METNTSLGQDARAVCAECGASFSVDDMVRHGAAYVCAKCKPVFMQKLAEGADMRTRKLRYAGFWIRFLAVLLDGIAMFLLLLAVGFALGSSLTQTAGLAPRPVFVVIVQQFLGLIIGISYETFFIGKYGATLGKMICRIQVVSPDGGRISYLRALGRYFAKLLNTFTLTIGYIIAAFDSEKRALHDRICNTRVVMD